MKNDPHIIKQLEKEFFNINQLKQVKIKDNGEKLVDLKKIDPSIILIPKKRSVPITGNTIFVRSIVAKKLKAINQHLIKDGLVLKIIDGYRPLEVQKKSWQIHLSRTKKQYPNLSKRALEEKTIKFCAKPELSFHPTGGSVDITIAKLKTKRELWMGTKVDDYVQEAYTHYPYLSKAAINNRKILFQEMDKKGFYNFPSEWWHFSYGTIDWALHYDKPCAIYDVKKFKK